MHLKRVEVENFKSFGRKLAIPFLEGFTAITGPNGSGKSNIGDAVLFVLGPKSNKAIRAGKLTDLIFNGGKDASAGGRKAADYCKVSLVFDNPTTTVATDAKHANVSEGAKVARVIPVDADEVTLTRLVKLSKSDPEGYYSYFYVNGKPSSLHEFDNLLAHSRISAEGYNIVRQGDVTRIVQMGDVERRRVLDDIAGITKFDDDIAKAMNEKAKVEENLGRVGIILTEIDAQLVTLERERDAALRYKSVKDDLDLTRAKLAKKRRDAAAAEIESVHASLVRGEAERANLEREIVKLTATLAAAEKSLAEIDTKIAARGGAEAADLRTKIEALRASAVRATEQVNYRKQQLDELKDERGVVESDAKRVEKDLAKFGKERAAAATDAAAVSSKLAEKDAALEAVRGRISGTAGKAADLQRELALMRNEYETSQLELNQSKLDLERAADRKSRLITAHAELGESIETAAFEMKDVDFSLKEIAKETSGTQTSVEDAKKDLLVKKKRESQLSVELKELDPAIRRLQHDYATLKAQQDASAAAARGFTRTVEAILEARDHGKLKGVHGTISELADVADKYSTALEVAAGQGRMQAVVVETDADAHAAIDWLKKNKLGRATFLPLNKMAPGRPAGKPLMAVRAPDAEGFAIDLVKFDEKYRNAFWYVFRDTVVVKNLEGARKLMGGVRLVTLDGDLIDAGGAMTGGESQREARSSQLKFGAVSKEELDKIASRLRAAVTSQDALSAELVTLRDDIAKLEARLREGAHATELKSGAAGDLAKKREEIGARLSQFAKDRATAEKDLAAVEKEIAKLGERIEALDARLKELDRERETKSKLVVASTSKELGSQLASLTDATDELRRKSLELASLVETKTHQVALVEERRVEIAKRLAALEEKRAEHVKAIAEGEKAVAKHTKELEVLVTVQSQQDERLAKLAKEREKAYEHRSDVANGITKLREKMDAAKDVELRWKAKLPELESQVSEMEAELAALGVDGFATAGPAQSEISGGSETTVALAVPRVTIPKEITETLDALRSKVRALDAKLAELGAVNMLALDEFERQAARKKDLTAESEHLGAEKSSLDSLVAEIGEKKKVGFFEVFHEINDNFGKIFGRLSDGGKAELLLEDAAEPFNGGLLMRAQPKGKKLTRLDALSGGEKSLASMAFIFAIQEFDPSPFYYLDEVDQNLDGINSELLARMVRDNSNHAQFIVVSLRKVTLKEADHVYGVTMLETGLSEVVGEVRISEIVDESERAETKSVKKAVVKEEAVNR
ncbi:MAG: chromosome segregation protein SMC [Thermoplasmatota archaeon]